MLFRSHIKKTTNNVACDMKAFIFTLFASLVSVASFADEPAKSPLELWKEGPMIVFEATDVDLDAFLWQARPIVIFGNTSEDIRVTTQLDNLLTQAEEIIDRDIVLILDTDPSAQTDIRTELRPRDFHWVLIGKDGDVKLRKPRPWAFREISRVIDKMPLRKQELETRE